MNWIRLCQFVSTRVVCATLILITAQLAHAEQSRTADLPIYATEAQNGYREMLASATQKAVYLLGDASHGTEEYYAFRRQITQHLISDYGVRAVLLEEEWDSVEQVNHYILGETNDALTTRKLLDQALPRWPPWLWNNQQTVKFIDWLREWNRGHSETDQVKLLGMDMKEAILPAINRLSTLLTAPSHAGEELARLERFWEVVLRQSSGELENPTEVADAHSQIRLSLTKLSGLHDNAQPLLEMLDFANQYYASFRGDYYGTWNIRSEYMTRFVVANATAMKAGSALAVWAHNNHVGDKSADDVQGSGLINMGQLVRERLGKGNVFILGSASYRGEVLAARSWQKHGEVQAVAPARDQSIEKLLHQSPWSNPLLYFDSAENQQRWSFDVLHRGIGAVFDSDIDDGDTWSITNIAKRYDALVFWKITGALQQ